jgi:hypothetical protein
MVQERRPGELMFEAYLEEHGYPAPAYEPDLGISKRPDYVVECPDGEVICEVEEFDPIKMTSGGLSPVGQNSLKAALAPVRNKIRAAAAQVKELADSGRPLVAVLANPGGAWVPLGEKEMVWAMYGDPAFVFSVDREAGEALGGGEFVATRNGKLRNDHPYLSAVAVISVREHAVDFYEVLAASMEGASADEKTEAIFAAKREGEVPEGSYHRITVYETISSSAAPLPQSIFSGAHDRRFRFDADTGAYIWDG